MLEKFLQEAASRHIEDTELAVRRQKQHERISELFQHTIIVTKIMYQ